MDQPEWFQSKRDVKIYDAVLFIKKDGPLLCDGTSVRIK